jgi:hypothetical protein
VRLYSRRLDCGLIRVYVQNIVVHEWLPGSFGDVGEDRREVGCCLVHVGDGRVEALRVAVEHSCRNVWRLWLGLSVGLDVWIDQSSVTIACIH